METSSMLASPCSVPALAKAMSSRPCPQHRVDQRGPCVDILNPVADEQAADLGCQRLANVGLRSGEHHFGAIGGQTPHRACADPAGPARYKRNFSFQPAGH
jgi:hypothetical protein